MSLFFSKDNNIISYINNDKNKKVDSISYNNQDESGMNEIILQDGYNFVLAPRPISEKERMTFFVAGESGAGKSYFIREMAKRYKVMFPNNNIYLISYLDRDETLDAYKDIIRLNCFNDEFLNECLSYDLEQEFKHSFVIFDDIDSITEKKVKQVIYNLLNKMLRIGRHFNISVAYLGHELYSSHELKNILNESMTITFFPRFLNYKKLRYLLEVYFGLSKAQIERIRKIKDRSITYIKGADKIIMSEHEMFIL